MSATLTWRLCHPVDKDTNLLPLQAPSPGFTFLRHHHFVTLTALSNFFLKRLEENFASRRKVLRCDYALKYSERVTEIPSITI
ncbi:uncharacterized protein LACBIDRAFT_318918 [Laccaria bicolor S238N-H82]|uniref:Predicted protein n=1 Tax=Laccaria bicolor (strain S238N-H82 / ATCC MYA-4686) TaxID=486041 RepID=B0D7F4_LACBS|nr:uncharacterized protein LACBIDRAFT_318918 [Laccaria bicolor S238N-H82]EDR09643.1 predicted protein [Laccaria bicolor S238N-H82]|eukprot:XP_001879992.1 predicted protein [Laccaria bicolor S238N-H82]